MSELQHLQPQLLWQWFDQICAIPHPSFHENALAEHIIQWAKSKNFFAERDEVGNVLIRKPATEGMEECEPVALQAHLDMVPQANEHIQHDFERDPIRPYIEGEWVTAENTTLGADNGIGMAAALAVLTSDDIAHPQLEVLLTMTEETGMDGAVGLRANWLKAQTMINLDTEEIGEIYIGCAGGENADVSLPIQWQENHYSQSVTLSLKGLRGGHSGIDIHKNHANAIKMLVRFLAKLQKMTPHFDFVLSEIRGGSIRNAIPREAVATLCFNDNLPLLQQAVNEFNQQMQQEWGKVEANLRFTIMETATPIKTFTHATTQQLINFFNVLPNGVVRNSDVIANVVETSLSLGVLHTTETAVQGVILVRSLIETGMDHVASQLQSLATLSHAEVQFSGRYPGWEPVSESPLLKLTQQIYTNILGKQPKIQVIHAGLECGLIKKTYPNMDIISIGPTIKNAHSPDEKVHIDSVKIFWQTLIDLLSKLSINN